MISKLFPFLLIILLLLSACQTKTLIFTGESDNWSAKYKAIKSGDIQEEELALIYLGNDVKSVGEFTFNVESNAGGFGGTGATLTDGGVFQAKGNMSSGGASVTKDAEIVVTVEWNDKKENVSLKSE
jgi:hypothetical protein